MPPPMPGAYPMPSQHNGPPVQPPYLAQGYGYPAPIQVAPKSPGLALLAACFVPGLGSLGNGEVGKGIGIFFGWCVSWLLTVILIGFFGLLGFWIWGMVDGYQGARRWNAAHGIIS